ncbi:hypothetical protein ACWDTP_15655 [Mycobacterium sp. NPDC003449]
MRRYTRWAATPVVVLAVALDGSGAAAADSPGLKTVPLENVIRQCGFGIEPFLAGNGNGTGSGMVGLGDGGSGTVRADVRLQTARPDTAYRVRLIQMPRAAEAPCNAGDPGVAVGMMHTDAAGNGFVTVTGPRQAGATGGWVWVEGPPVPGLIHGDVYTSGSLVPV